MARRSAIARASDHARLHRRGDRAPARTSPRALPPLLMTDFDHLETGRSIM